MDQIRIKGGKPLSGSIRIGGAKNAALPLMAATLLTDEAVTLGNMPNLADIITMSRLLDQHGCVVSPEAGDNRKLTFQAKDITSITAPYDLVRKMRASVLVLGPILARCHKAKVSLPGGCAIGTRPIDLHLSGLEKMGAQIELEGGYIHAKAPQGGLQGAEIVFPQVSVGATENLLMAAALATGTTVLKNAAREPEIGNLAEMLNMMGAHITGIGSDQLTIIGAEKLSGARLDVIHDRIEAGTYMMLPAITGGELTLTGGGWEYLEAAQSVLEQAGVAFTQTNEGLKVSRVNGLHGVDVMTEPYPGFPTDLQAQMMSLMCVADGAAMLTETIFENRFMHVPELARMGADITVHGASALVRGVKQLVGAPVMATDLRASVSLVMAGLAAEGETVISRIYHLDRGYEFLEDKLAGCGADIERINGAE